jgi:hypothetical protein
MTGSMGYPALLIAMNDDWRELLVEHYNRDASFSPITVKAGDQMRIAWDGPFSGRTYWVVKMVPSKERLGAFVVWLEAVPPKRVTILGQSYP